MRANIVFNNLIKNINSLEYSNDDFLYRISMISDLERVKRYGSSRICLSDKLWDKLESIKHLPIYKSTLRHDEVIIASYFDDIQKDSLLLNGTLEHKLNIYEKPFFTLYKKNELIELMSENNTINSQNNGTHFYFKNSPLQALHSLWSIDIATLEVLKIE